MKAEARYVAICEQHGSLRPGIHHMKVYFVNRKAVIMHGNIQAYVVPKSITFRTREEAQAYYAGKGDRKWVIFRNGRKEATEVAEAWVKEAFTFSGYGGRSKEWCRIICRVGSPKAEVDRYFQRTEIFDTRAEAEEAAMPYLRNELREAVKEAKAWGALARHLSGMVKRIKGRS